MALSESIEYDKIEIVSEYKNVQVRKATVIKRDGVEISRSYDRYMLHSGDLDASDNFVDNPLTKEPDGVTDIPDDIKSICNAVWTTEVKNLLKAKLIANKSEFGPS
tara:strand:+ start:347 stop:664 length:318 start_codon:yes stop_codon:yes gene_type:complete